MTATKLAEVETQHVNGAEPGSSAGGDDVRDVQGQLEKTRSELASLTDQLTKARQHADQYKTIADGLQTTITEQNNVSWNDECKRNVTWICMSFHFVSIV